MQWKSDKRGPISAELLQLERISFMQCHFYGTTVLACWFVYTTGILYPMLIVLQLQKGTLPTFKGTLLCYDGLLDIANAILFILLVYGSRRIYPKA